MLKRLLKPELLITLLILVSVVLVLWHRVGMDRWYIIEPSVHTELHARADSLEGGNSIATLQRTDSSALLHFELNLEYPYPFAGLQFFLGDGQTQGVDLSQYDSLFFYIRAVNQNTLRIYLRGWDSAFSKLEDPVSLKFNELEYAPKKEGYPARFVPSELRVASWWVAQRVIDPHKARVDLSNIPLIEIQTGTDAPLGKGSIEVMKIAFKGKLISAESLYLAILTVWVGAFLGWLLFRTVHLSQTIRKNLKRQAELEGVNSVLKIQSEGFEKMAKEDPLTGCLNRFGFRNILHEATTRIKNSRKPLSLILFDIDHFKHINDTYGHSTGDMALVNIATVVRARVRHSDHLVRWGGEEFIILCPETTLNNAERLADNLRRQLEDCALIPQATITCSFGVTSMRPNEEVESAFDRVDKALYQSKATGRNKVTVIK